MFDIEFVNKKREHIVEQYFYSSDVFMRSVIDIMTSRDRVIGNENDEIPLFSYSYTVKNFPRRVLHGKHRTNLYFKSLFFLLLEIIWIFFPIKNVFFKIIRYGRH